MVAGEGTAILDRLRRASDDLSALVLQGDDIPGRLEPHRLVVVPEKMLGEIERGQHGSEVAAMIRIHQFDFDGELSHASAGGADDREAMASVVIDVVSANVGSRKARG